MGQEMKKAIARVCGAVSFTLLATCSLHAQNIGGLIGGMMEQAIRAQQQQQYLEQQQRAIQSQQRARSDADRVQQRAEQARREDQRRQEAARTAELKKQEAEKVQAEKAAAARQARLAKIQPAAKQLLDEGSEFLRRNPELPQLLELAESLRTLSRLLAEGDPGAIEESAMALSSDLRKDPSYVAYSSQVAEERQQRSARFLADAITLAGVQKQFLLRQISRDPTSAANGAFAPLVKQLSAAIERPNLDEIGGLTTRVDLKIREGGLAIPFQQFAFSAPADKNGDAGQVKLASVKPGSAAKANEQPPRETAPPASDASSKTSHLTLATTDKNKFVLEGDLDDLVLLYNTSTQAPHILRNLRGELILEGGQADVCAYQVSRDRDVEVLTRKELEKYRPERVNFVPAACQSESILNYDVVAFRRGQFLASRPQYALSLIKEIEVDNFKHLNTLKSEDMKARTNANLAKALEIETDLENRSRDGSGFLRVNQNTSTVCALMPEKIDGHRRILMSKADELSTYVGANPTVVPSSLDGAFANSKRGQCGAIYAPAKDLKELIAGFKRDGISFSVIPSWIEPSEIELGNERSLKEKELAEQQSFERKRKNEEQRKIAALRDADRASSRTAQEAALRLKYEKPAAAASAKIALEVTDFLAQQTPSLAARYPDFVNWYGAKVQDRWEVMQVNSELADYGQANWKGRMLEAAFSRVTIRLKNRMLGDYEDACFVFGRLNDNEFSMMRDHFEASCDDADASIGWKRAHSFASVWLVE